jgi:hypothetical protein
MITAKEAIELMKNEEKSRVNKMLMELEEKFKKAAAAGFVCYFFEMKPQDGDIDTIKNKLIEAGFSVHETVDGDGDPSFVVSWKITDRIKKKIEIMQSKFEKKMEQPFPSSGIAGILGC